MFGQLLFWKGLTAALTFPKAIFFITLSQQVLCQTSYLHHLQQAKHIYDGHK